MTPSTLCCVDQVALSDKEPQKLAAGTMEGRVHVIDVASQREVHVLEHSHGVVKVEFLHSRQALVASTLGGMSSQVKSIQVLRAGTDHQLFIT